MSVNHNIASLVPIKKWRKIMSVPSKIHNIRLVKIRPEERLAVTLELNLTSNMKGLQSYYYHTVRIAFKWINRRSQKKSYNGQRFNRFFSFNPLPKPRIYHLTYTIFKRRGYASEEPDKEKPPVWFCERAHRNPGAITPIGGVL